MLVGRSNFAEVVSQLSVVAHRSVDCEATGLRVHHGDRLFSIIIGAEDGEFYFNYQDYPDLEDEFRLPRLWIKRMQAMFDPVDSEWDIMNAKYDMHLLANEDITIHGTVHCIRTGARLEYNQHHGYSLDKIAARMGEAKSDAVMDYIKANGLIEKIPIPGKATKEERMFFDRVPHSIIIPYGCTDARITRKAGVHQRAYIAKIDAEMPSNLPKLQAVLENERQFTKTAFAMERRGIHIDADFCRRAIQFETERAQKHLTEFTGLTGEAYSASPVLFARVFADQKERWSYTEKGNPSFDGDAIERFDSPVAREVLALRDAKAKADFYHGFLYHADRNDDIHPTLNQDGAGHGRTSASDPNLQNLKKDDKATVAGQEFVVRRAIIPRPGFTLLAPDWKQVEFRLLLDRAGEMGVIRRIMEDGLDPHDATGKEAGVDRDFAKRINFGLIYEQGADLLAYNLKVSRKRALEIKDSVLGGMPKVAEYLWNVKRTAAQRGYVFNWLGRRLQFPDSRFAYRAPNHVIAGGAADVAKIALNQIEDLLIAQGCRSRLIWIVHDEPWVEMADGEEWIVPEIKHIMETAYPHRHLPLEADVSWSDKSVADKKPWEAKAA